ncbi:MAG: hypothetical protein Q9208_000263 [Pyrenodesmia sp. 3 TL-2023]
MPLGIQRLNAHQSHPNDRIIFIKPLPGSDVKYAQDFLSRIAAICKPIMTSSHLSVTTLEEYEPNREFIGRNFNNGEIIQLVLKSRSGHWLSFRSVQMVMMHELAHCLHMNHGRDFWKTRNRYAEELRDLWGKGYTGDGFWGRGKTLVESEGGGHQGGGEEVMPERLCGGTFRTRRGRKRKREGVKAEELTWKEKKERRIEKKFGRNGQTLGGAEEVRVKLEKGQKVKGKPKVAGSSRGRELRAAAALARFGAQIEEEVTKEETKFDGSESGDESDSGEGKPEQEAFDLNGSKLLDSKGRGMVKICEDEDENDIHVKQELDEMHNLGAAVQSQESNRSRRPVARTSVKRKQKQPPVGDACEKNTILDAATAPVDREELPPAPVASTEEARRQITMPSTEREHHTITKPSCSICSMVNEPSSLLCVACSNVLQPRLMPGHWRCDSSTCEESRYINAADCGVCGVCGSRKPGGSDSGQVAVPMP